MRALRRQPAALGSHFFQGRILLHPGTPAPGPEVGAPPRPGGTGFYSSHWRSLDYFNLYRLVIAAILAILSLLATAEWPIGGEDPVFFRTAAFGYLVLSTLFILAIRARWPAFPIQLSLHIFTDIVFVTAITNASGGLSSGLGLLLLGSLASAGLVGQGRLVLMYASMASIAMLLLHTFRIFSLKALPSDYLLVGLLSLSYFALSWLAHILTQRALVLEREAGARARELALLNRIHALAAGDSATGIIAYAGDGSITYCNAQACKLLGKAPGEKKSASFRELFGGYGQVPDPSGASELELPGGHVRLRSLPVEDSGHTVLLMEDLSHAEKLAQQIKLASLGRLTLNIAHEIRNPLSAINHASELLAEDAGSPATGKLTGIIRNNVQRLDHMVQDILSLNRRDRQEPASLEVAGFVGAWLKEWQQTEEIPESAVIVEMENTAAVTACFVPQHLRQILWNLGNNAWRHSRKEAGSLHFRLHADLNDIVLEVGDDGTGIRPENQARLFEPFFTTNTQGTGLGLFIARELAESNDAHLEFVGNRPGACFRLTLPNRPC